MTVINKTSCVFYCYVDRVVNQNFLQNKVNAIVFLELVVKLRVVIVILNIGSKNFPNRYLIRDNFKKVLILQWKNWKFSKIATIKNLISTKKILTSRIKMSISTTKKILFSKNFKIFTCFKISKKIQNFYKFRISKYFNN